MKCVTIHTDGACEGNPGPGGWAAILRFGAHTRELSGGDPATTNNRMELQAALAALQALKEPCRIELYTDSAYLRDGMTEWLAGWKRRGWVTMEKKPVRNEDLWRALDAQDQVHLIRWHWLKGHAGHPDNERCDLLAKTEVSKLRKQFSRDQFAALQAAFEQARAPENRQKPLL
jgi:ribonuclease HI